MGLVATTLRSNRSFGAKEEELLWNLIQVIIRADGVVEPAEMKMVEALSRTVPQLRAGRSDTRPTLSRKALLDECATLTDENFRRQLWVIAVEAALSSGHVNEPEDQYLEHLRRALKLDEAFARTAVEIVAYKYGR